MLLEQKNTFMSKGFYYISFRDKLFKVLQLMTVFNNSPVSVNMDIAES